MSAERRQALKRKITKVYWRRKLKVQDETSTEEKKIQPEWRGIQGRAPLKLKSGEGLLPGWRHKKET